MESLTENKALMVSLAGSAAFLICLITGVSPDVNSQFQTVLLPPEVTHLIWSSSSTATFSRSKLFFSFNGSSCACSDWIWCALSSSIGYWTSFSVREDWLPCDFTVFRITVPYKVLISILIFCRAPTVLLKQACYGQIWIWFDVTTLQCLRLSRPVRARDL